jgi:GDP-4-dehydro-6-deoxy-D-mannose reductase
MKTLITGGAGFAGTYLAEYLLRQGCEILPFNLDLRDTSGCEQFMRTHRPQRIYHLAAISSSVESLEDPSLTYAVNFGGTLNLLNAWRKLEFDCRFLMISSSEVYGSACGQELPLNEEAPLRPKTPYSASKAAAEMLGIQFCSSWGLPIVRVRPFHHTGPGQAPRFVCASFAQQVAEIAAGLRTPLIAVGNTKIRRDFSDVRDIVRGYHLLLEKGQAGEVYQLCSGRAVSIESILQTLIATSDVPAQVIVDPARVRAGEPDALWGDYSKAKLATGWSPEIPLEQTLQELARACAIRNPSAAS